MIPLPTQYSFHDSFWTSTSQHEPLPKFSQGLSVLHTKLTQSMEENDAIILYLSKRIQAEQHYAQYLDTIIDNNNMMDDVFERDMGASLKQCYHVVRTESKSSAEAHLSRANNLLATALDPVERMAAKYTKIVTTSKATMTAFIDQFQIQAQLTVNAHNDYINKCKKLLSNDPSYRPPRGATVTLANKTWHRNDLIFLLDRLQQTHQPLLGQNILDEMVAQYSTFDSLDKATTNTREMAILACQDLLDQNWIVAFTTETTKAVEDNSTTSLAPSQQITTFTTTPDVTYAVMQHPQLSSGYYSYSSSSNSDIGSSAEDVSSTNSTTTTVSSSSSSSSLGFWSRQRWTSAASKQSDFHQLLQDMEKADLLYKQAIHKAESLRMEIEENLFIHFDEMESLELERIQTLKQAFISMAAAFSNTIPIYKDTYDRMMLYQETLRPDKDIQVIVEQYRTSKFCPRPILYENYFSGSNSDQLFGIPIENVVDMEKTQVPLLIVNGLAVIESELPHLHNEERKKIWTTPLPLDLIHKIRNELNRTNGSSISQETLKKHNILLLASVLWLYLLELPDCLITFELYDTIKLLYVNQNQQDNDCHFASIGKLMTTLPSANYETLKTLLHHLKRVMEAAEDSTLIQTLISRFTQIIIRPDSISAMNRHDRHPHRFMRDLLEHTDIIFSKEIDQGQHNHHVRQQQQLQRQQRAASTQLDSRNSSLELHNSKLPSLDSSSMASTTSTSNRYSDDLVSPEAQQQLLKDRAGSQGVSLLSMVSTKPNLPTPTSQPPPPPVRRRSLMSFVRRSSNTSTMYDTTTTGHSDTALLGQQPPPLAPPTAIIHSSSTTTRRPPIPMPSTSTLFEDPEEIDLTPSPPPSKTVQPGPLGTNEDDAVPPNIIPGTEKSTLQSRFSSSSTVEDDDDHISLDSFFL